MTFLSNLLHTFSNAKPNLYSWENHNLVMKFFLIYYWFWLTNILHKNLVFTLMSETVQSLLFFIFSLSSFCCEGYARLVNS